MKINQLSLKNFRTHSSSNYDFVSGLNFILGKNKVGKTSILEALNLLSTAKSPRTKNIKNTIKHERGHSVIECNTNDDRFKIIITPKKNRYFLNELEKDRVVDFISVLKVIFFSPEDVFLFSTTPKKKRNFIDSILVHSDIEFLYSLVKYNKLLKQRNSHLKSEKVDKSYLSIIDEEFVKLGIYIIKSRQELVDFINSQIKDTHNKIFNSNDQIELKYHKNITTETFEKNIKNNIDKDIMMKVTLVGPHKDDFDFVIDKDSIVESGSYSQKKIFMFSLKYSMSKYLESKISYTPIFLLDDLFGGLDTTTSYNLLKFLDGTYQTIITSTDLNGIDLSEFSNSKIIDIKEMSDDNE